MLIFSESVFKLSLNYHSSYNVFNFKFKSFILNFTKYTSFYIAYFKKEVNQLGYLAIFSCDRLIRLSCLYQLSVKLHQVLLDSYYTSLLKEHGVTPRHRRRLLDLRRPVGSDQVDVLKLNFKVVAIGSIGPFQVVFMPFSVTQVFRSVEKADMLTAWQGTIVACRGCHHCRTQRMPLLFIIATHI